jgi:hypothetical protein
LGSFICFLKSQNKPKLDQIVADVFSRQEMQICFYRAWQRGMDGTKGNELLLPNRNAEEAEEAEEAEAESVFCELHDIRVGNSCTYMHVAWMYVCMHGCMCR